MRSRYGALAIYSILLACVAAGVLFANLRDGVAFPSWWVVILGIGACLFVWQFGLRAPRLGLISMERLPQIGFLLVFEPAVAASICAAASLVWPLVSRRYSQGSSKVAALRAVHNGSMTALMLMSAGHVYLSSGGRHPLTGLIAADVFPLVAMALTAQAVNVGLMILFFGFDRRDVRRIVTPSYALSDLIFVPAGILAAVLYNTGNTVVFGLFAGLMLLFVLSFNSIGTQRDPDPAERGPLTRLFEASLKLQGARRVDELAERILAETRALFRFDEMHSRARRSRAEAARYPGARTPAGPPARAAQTRRRRPVWLAGRARGTTAREGLATGGAGAGATGRGGNAGGFVARRATRQRGDRAGTAVRAAHAARYLRNARTCTSCGNWVNRSRARWRTRARSKTWKIIAGISRSAWRSAPRSSRRRTRKRSA